MSDLYTMNRNIPEVAAAVELGVCRHCDQNADLCVDCARCASCQCSPNCVTREIVDPAPPPGPNPFPPPSIETD